MSNYGYEEFLHDDRETPTYEEEHFGEVALYEDVTLFEEHLPEGKRDQAITVRVDQRGSRVVQDRSAAAAGNLLVSVSGEGRGRSRRVIVEEGQEGWEYRDREGVMHGPFAAARILKWLDRGYFNGSLQIRRVGPQGSQQGSWSTLDQVLPHVKQEAAAEGAGGAAMGPRAAVPVAAAARIIPDGDSSGYGGRGYSAGRGAVLGDFPQQAWRGSRRYDGGSRADEQPYQQQPQQGGYGGRRGRGAGRGGGRPLSPEGYAAHPHEQYVVRGEGYGSYSGGYGRSNGDDGYGGGDRGRGRGRRGGREPRGGGGRGEGRGRGRGGDRGGGAARGGGGRGPPGPDPAVKEAVQRLFSAEAKLGTEQPMWRYIDPDGNMQGPFPASNMVEWHAAGYLHDMQLPVCGTERKVSPPNLPTPDFFVPLGKLIAYVKAGNKFTPVHVEDIRSGMVPEYIQELRGGKPAGAKKATAAAGAKARGDAKEKPVEAAAAPKTDEQLAAELVAAAVHAVLVAAGEAPALEPAGEEAASLEQPSAAGKEEHECAPLSRTKAAAGGGQAQAEGETEVELDRLAAGVAAAAVHAALVAAGEGPAPDAEPAMEPAAPGEQQQQQQQQLGEQREAQRPQEEEGKGVEGVLRGGYRHGTFAPPAELAEPGGGSTSTSASPTEGEDRQPQQDAAAQQEGAAEQQVARDEEGESEEEGVDDEEEDFEIEHDEGDLELEDDLPLEDTPAVAGAVGGTDAVAASDGPAQPDGLSAGSVDGKTAPATAGQQQEAEQQEEPQQQQQEQQQDEGQQHAVSGSPEQEEDQGKVSTTGLPAERIQDEQPVEELQQQQAVEEEEEFVDADEGSPANAGSLADEPL
ncbi:hypothetical protein N2152v2_003207 [Parachlorella kessleri]